MYEAIVLDNTYLDLEPFISKKALEIHYQMYKENVEILNRLLQENGYSYQYSLLYLINHIDMFPLSVRGEILYYLSSVLNHELYFYNISSSHHTSPVGGLKEDIQKTFQSYEKFREEFIKKAMELKGSGYTFLVLNDKKELEIMNTSNEDSPYYYGFTPIICLDLWEHAYFLDYYGDKMAYINNFFEVIDFLKLEKYYQQMKESRYFRI